MLPPALLPQLLLPPLLPPSCLVLQLASRFPSMRAAAAPALLQGLSVVPHVPAVASKPSLHQVLNEQYPD